MVPPLNFALGAQTPDRPDDAPVAADSGDFAYRHPILLPLSGSPAYPQRTPRVAGIRVARATQIKGAIHSRVACLRFHSSDATDALLERKHNVAISWFPRPVRAFFARGCAVVLPPISNVRWTHGSDRISVFARCQRSGHRHGKLIGLKSR